MTDTVTEVKPDAIQSLCDKFLADISFQSIVEQSKVVDFLLDLRALRALELN